MSNNTLYFLYQLLLHKFNLPHSVPVINLLHIYYSEYIFLLYLCLLFIISFLKLILKNKKSLILTTNNITILNYCIIQTKFLVNNFVAR